MDSPEPKNQKSTDMTSQYSLSKNASMINEPYHNTYEIPRYLAVGRFIFFTSPICPAVKTTTKATMR